MLKDGNDTPSASPLLCAFYLGRLQGAIAGSSPAARNILAGRLVRESLVHALRTEGHAFTETRFHEWFAGLRTLSDSPARSLRPPRALCQAILTELAHSSWQELSGISSRLATACLAPSDLADPGAHEDAHAIVAQGRALVAAIETPGEEFPFRAVEAVHAAAARHLLFARAEPEAGWLAPAAGFARPASPAPASCAWAIDIQAGALLAAPLALPLAFPLPGFLALQPPRVEDPGECAFDPPPCETADLAITALCEALWKLDRMLAEAILQARDIASRAQGRRSTSRAIPMLEFLAGFGSLRGSQIERLAGVTRPGVRKIIAAMADMGLVASCRSANNTAMFRYEARARAEGDTRATEAPFAFTVRALEDYDESIRAIEALLARSGVR